MLRLSQLEAKEGASRSKDGGIVVIDSLEMDLDVMESFSCSMLLRLP